MITVNSKVCVYTESLFNRIFLTLIILPFCIVSVRGGYNLTLESKPSGYLIILIFLILATDIFAKLFFPTKVYATSTGIEFGSFWNKKEILWEHIKEFEAYTPKAYWLSWVFTGGLQTVLIVHVKVDGQKPETKPITLFRAREAEGVVHILNDMKTFGFDRHHSQPK